MLGPYICISTESKRIKKSNNEEGGDKHKKVRPVIDNEKQVDVWWWSSKCFINL